MQYVQIDDRSSERINFPFGVPQRSILVLFNLHVNDLTEVLPIEEKCHQYSDDTTTYCHCKRELQNCQAEMQPALDKLSSWSSRYNLPLNLKKTKLNTCFNCPDVTNSRTRRTLHQSLRNCKGSGANFNFPLTCYGSHENLNRKIEINSAISSCYGTCLY